MAAQEREMSTHVDENDERLADKTIKPKFDWDAIFAYKTFKVVRILDRNLGILYWGIVTSVIMYVIIFAFYYEGKHAQRDPGIGTVITRFKGKAFSDIGTGEDAVYDEADLRFPVIEPSGAFIMTKRVIVSGQKMGKCLDMDNHPVHCPCSKNQACNNQSGLCEITGWCPSIGVRNSDDPPAGSIAERIHGLEHTYLSIMSGIAFPNIGNHFYVTGASTDATNPYKNITLGELLQQAQFPIDIEDILETGALVGVSFFWSCDVTTECEPNIIIKRLDDGQGFVQKRVRHRREDGEEVRDAIYMHGLRILVDSSGIGQKTALVLIVIQLGSAIALMRTASIAADFMMLRLYSADRRDAYYKCKVIETKDYSDLQDRINLIQDAQQTSNPMLARIGGGAQVPLGLGPGGRGGMAQAVLRGRNRV